MVQRQVELTVQGLWLSGFGLVTLNAGLALGLGRRALP